MSVQQGAWRFAAVACALFTAACHDASSAPGAPEEPFDLDASTSQSVSAAGAGSREGADGGGNPKDSGSSPNNIAEGGLGDAALADAGAPFDATFPPLPGFDASLPQGNGFGLADAGALGDGAALQDSGPSDAGDAAQHD